MKKLVTGLIVISLLAVGTLVYAHGTGYGGGQMGQGYGSHMGQGYGGHMSQGYGGHMGQGYGGHMMGYGPGAGKFAIEDEAGQKFLEETYDLRREMHDKKFEYREALRNPDTKLETITKLEREMQGIKEKIREKAPLEAQKRIGGYGGYGGCWQ